MSETSERLRREWGEKDGKRNEGLKTPEEVVRFDSLSYGPEPCWNLLDVFRPREAGEKPLPVILVVHGGAWVYGDKELYQFYAMELARRGFAVVSYSYRLAPEFKFPAQLEDTNQVVAWMYENQETYHLDMRQVFAVGDSAGAHLLGLYLAVCTDPAYAARYAFAVPKGFLPRAVAFNCGVFNLSQRIRGEQADRDLREDFLPEAGSWEEQAFIHVTDHVNPAFPPVYLMTAYGDDLKHQTLQMKELLEKLGILHVFREYGDEKTPLYHVFQNVVQEPLGQVCNDEECEFFRRFSVPL